MKFLIILKNKYMTPPEMVPSLIDATLAWAHKYEGQIEQIWSLAGQLWSFRFCLSMTPLSFQAAELTRRSQDCRYSWGVPCGLTPVADAEGRLPGT